MQTDFMGHPVHIFIFLIIGKFEKVYNFDEKLKRKCSIFLYGEISELNILQAHLFFRLLSTFSQNNISTPNFSFILTTV